MDLFSNYYVYHGGEGCEKRFCILSRESGKIGCNL